ncbi:MAG TPA: aldolase/citrate lyase family protein [Gaiellaceae bacterium]|nr:aldolase/citrate lyase family protein [Gaiellaceae bacterium]
MSERRLHGLAASPGVAAGDVWVFDASEDPDEPHRGHDAERAAALGALVAEAAELGAQAQSLRAHGFADEAEILAANQLMALDPLLRDEVARLTAELTAPEALRAATARNADLLAALDDPLLAARATDVRELGRRTARSLAGGVATPPRGVPVVVVASDLGPADVADLRTSEAVVAAIALARGAATSHAAIVARSLGLPMVVAVGEDVLDQADRAVVDGNDGVLYLDPSPERTRWAAAEMERLADRRRSFARSRVLPPVTRDGQWVTLLCNAATTVEIEAGIAAEADGVGLLRTELAFLDAPAWPTEAEHERALAPLLALLPGRVATVRVLDFGEDKTPPFLHGTSERGLALLLEQPEQLTAQLRALLRSAGTAELRVLLPLVESAHQMRTVRALLRSAAADVGRSGPLPSLGAMIETPEAARNAREIAGESDFLSLGTNDLVQYTLGYDRTEPLATAASAADPRVLTLIAATVTAAHEADVAIEVCGESASLPELAALYVGLGIDELSVAPARIDEVRATVRSLRADLAADASTRALAAESQDAALAIARRLLSDELGHQEHEVLGGRDGVLA